MLKNIIYQTDAIGTYFSQHRRSWNGFYPSERYIFEKYGKIKGGFGRVLDVGCAAGGLASALSERFPVTSYTGIDLNSSAIIAGRQASDIAIPCEFIFGDVVSAPELAGRAFDTVFSLGCADWNVDTNGILDAAWRCVAPGGCLITSLRLTTGLSERSMDRTFQFIHYEDSPIPADAEKAAYVVLNNGEALALLGTLSPERVLGYGFWGKPSVSARTPFKEILFSVFAVFRAADGTAYDRTVFELDFPASGWSRTE